MSAHDIMVTAKSINNISVSRENQLGSQGATQFNDILAKLI